MQQYACPARVRGSTWESSVVRSTRTPWRYSSDRAARSVPFLPAIVVYLRGRAERRWGRSKRRVLGEGGRGGWQGSLPIKPAALPCARGTYSAVTRPAALRPLPPPQPSTSTHQCTAPRSVRESWIIAVTNASSPPAVQREGQEGRRGEEGGGLARGRAPHPCTGKRRPAACTKKTEVGVRGSDRSNGACRQGEREWDGSAEGRRQGRQAGGGQATMCVPCLGPANTCDVRPHLPSLPPARLAWINHLCSRATKRCGRVAPRLLQALKKGGVAHAEGQAFAAAQRPADDAAARGGAATQAHHRRGRRRRHRRRVLRRVCRCFLRRRRLCRRAPGRCRLAAAAAADAAVEHRRLAWLHAHRPQLNQALQLRVGPQVACRPLQRCRGDVGPHHAPAAQRGAQQAVDEVSAAPDVQPCRRACAVECRGRAGGAVQRGRRERAAGEQGRPRGRDVGRRRQALARWPAAGASRAAAHCARTHASRTHISLHVTQTRCALGCRQREQALHPVMSS